MPLSLLVIPLLSQHAMVVGIVFGGDPLQVGLDLGAAGIVAAPLGVILEGELVGMRGYVACDPWISASQQTCLISVIDQIKKRVQKETYTFSNQVPPRSAF